MTKPLLCCLLACIFISFNSNSQAPCGFDLVHKKLIARDPAYARRVAADNESIRNYILKHPQGRTQARGQAIYTIPVVVHVMHTGGVVGSIYNPTDAQITG